MRCPEPEPQQHRGVRATDPLIVALDKSQLAERSGRLPRQQLEAVLSGVDVVLGR